MTRALAYVGSGPLGHMMVLQVSEGVSVDREARVTEVIRNLGTGKSVINWRRS